jgi:mevalonate kinase
MVAGEYILFWKHLKELSAFQLEHLRAMIPSHLAPVWEQGLTSDSHYLKLCGSGGGGFLTGFAKSYTNFSKAIAPQRLSHFPVYLSGLNSEQ